MPMKRPQPKVVAEFVGGPYDGHRMPIPAAFTQLVLCTPHPPGPNVRYSLVSDQDEDAPPRYTYLGIEPSAPPTPLPERPF